MHFLMHRERARGPDPGTTGSTLPGRPFVAAASLGLAAATLACGGAVGSGGDGTGAEARPGASLDDLPPDAMEVAAEGLDTPWELRFLPGGDLLVTERGGDLVRIEPPADGDADAPGRVVERHEVPGVRETGEAGLMGLALHPDYPDPPWIYVCHTTGAGGGLQNRVVRFRYADGRLAGGATMLSGMQGAPVHDGCRLEFGPDGGLFVTMGDAGASGRAQQRAALNGKILRIDENGDVPPGNPFGTPVWSLGHRNPQGLAFDDRGRLWSTEHGPSGLASGRDELNLVEKGGNYGWPEVTGGESAEGLRGPVLHSGSDTWAPAGMAYLDGRLWFGGLAGEALYEVRNLGVEADGGAGADGEAAEGSADRPPPLPRLVRHLAGELGRIRAVRAGPDGRLWLATSNRDGRGSPRPGDDRVLALDPAALDGR
jgi:glucose/arabinose dehydrogenase